MAGSQIGRCSNGHLFTYEPSSEFGLSLGSDDGSLSNGKKLMRCPVDRKWRVVERVRPEQLSEEEIERARNWAPLKP